MEWAKQTEDTFKSWADMQRKMWDDWMKGIQNLGRSQPEQVWDKTLDAWEDSVKRTLDTQIEWTRAWADGLSSVKGTPSEMAEWARQGQEMATRWGETQRQLWQNWFETVRKLRPSAFGGSWDREGQRFVQAWQDAVHKALEAQAEWMRFWTVGQAGEKTK
jgi:hypothetical protein